MEIHIGPTRYLEGAGKCPVCHTTLDGYEYAARERKPEDWTPGPGDYSVCAHCGTLLRYELGMQYSVATRDDLKELQEKQPDDFTMLQSAIRAANEAIRQRRGERRTKGHRKRWH